MIRKFQISLFGCDNCYITYSIDGFSITKTLSSLTVFDIEFLINRGMTGLSVLPPATLVTLEEKKCTVH